MYTEIFGNAVDGNDCLCNYVEKDVVEIMFYTQQAMNEGIHQPIAKTDYFTLDQPNCLPNLPPLMKVLIETDPISINDFDVLSENMVVEDVISTSITRVRSRHNRSLLHKGGECIDSSDSDDEVDAVPEIISFPTVTMRGTRTLGQMTLKDMETAVIKLNPSQERKYQPTMKIKTIQENESASKMKIKRILNSLKNDPLIEIRILFILL